MLKFVIDEATEFSVEDDEEQSPHVIRPYHEFIHAADKWEAEMNEVRYGKKDADGNYKTPPLPADVTDVGSYHAIHSLAERLKKELVAKKASLEKEKVTETPELEGFVNELYALKNRHTYNEGNPLSFSFTDVENLMTETFNKEPVEDDKKKINERYEKIKKQHNEFFQHYVCL